MLLVSSQNHGHSHYSPPDGEVEEGEKEKLQQNGEASSLTPGKVEEGEGELMLSPAQTPQVQKNVSLSLVFSRLDSLSFFIFRRGNYFYDDGI